MKILSKNLETGKSQAKARVAIKKKCKRLFCLFGIIYILNVTKMNSTFLIKKDLVEEKKWRTDLQRKIFLKTFVTFEQQSWRHRQEI